MGKVQEKLNSAEFQKGGLVIVAKVGDIKI